MRTNSRRLARLGALTLVAALAVGGPLAGAAFAGGNQDDETLATLQVEKDSVEVRKAGADDFKKAKDEQKLEEGDTVRTDETGRAEIQYDEQSFTRLDVDTTFTIVSLTDDEGNRKVEGSLDTGRTWNRAEGLTESESFEQSGAGATAAVQGTAFAIDCIATNECDYVGGVNDTTLRANEGENQTQTLLTLDLCKALSGELCNELSKLGPGDLFDFIQECLLRDLLERGLGPGPLFVQFNDGVLSVLTPAGGSPQSGTPAPDVPPTIDPIAPVLCENTCEVHITDFPDGFGPANGGDSITIDDTDAPLNFLINVVNPSGVRYWIVFTLLPDDPSGDDAGVVNYCSGTCSPVVVGERYDQTIPDAYFAFAPNNVTPSSSPAQAAMTFHTETDAGAASESETVPVTVYDNSIALSEGDQVTEPQG